MLLWAFIVGPGSICAVAYARSFASIKHFCFEFLLHLVRLVFDTLNICGNIKVLPSPRRPPRVRRVCCIIPSFVLGVNRVMNVA
jgi:hypothetical protein